MKTYYRVLHVYDLIDHAQVKDIGIFSTEEKALQAIEQERALWTGNHGQGAIKSARAVQIAIFTARVQNGTAKTK